HHYLQLSYVDFETAMEEVLSHPGQAYQAQVKELYTMGLYLARQKYRYLRYAYLTFLMGITTGPLLVAITLALEA
ncbi:MAG: Pycsar system effector family protein, partial [Candidatus Competibacterales bacterium]